jgi:hypothetical protein
MAKCVSNHVEGLEGVKLGHVMVYDDGIEALVSFQPMPRWC